jgi:AraC-like DNA-binding protein
MDGLGVEPWQRMMLRAPAKEPVVARALRDGWACVGRELPPTHWTALANHALCAVASPEDLASNRWWLLLVARRQGDYAPVEAERLLLWLRAMQCEFVQPREPGLGRLLVGHDDRALAAGLTVRERRVTNPDLLGELMSQLRPVLIQRYPGLADDQTHDLNLSLAGETVWVRVCRRRSTKLLHAERWTLELRPVGEGDVPPLGLVEDERVAAAVAHMHDAFEESPSLAELAKLVHMSPFHFHRVFSRAVGLSPKHFLQRCQLQYARWALRATPAPVHEIAARAGFSSHGHFTSTYHRLTGLSPTEYRDRHGR